MNEIAAALNVIVRLLGELGVIALMVAALRSGDLERERTLILWAIALLLTCRL